MTERELQQAVLQVARLRGWLAYHTHDSRRSQPGFPDLMLVRPPRVIVAELKSGAGRLRPQQSEWLAALQECPGVEVHVWRPLHWVRGDIEGVLA